MPAAARAQSAGTCVAVAVDSARVMFVPDSTEMLQLSFSLQRKDMEFSGLLVERADSGRLRGVIMNEFGVRALNFAYDPLTGDVETSDIMPFLDKFYIRPALRGLIRRLYSLRRCELGREVAHCTGTLSPDGNELTLAEPRYGLTLIVARTRGEAGEPQ